MTALKIRTSFPFGTPKILHIAKGEVVASFGDLPFVVRAENEELKFFSTLLKLPATNDSAAVEAGELRASFILSGGMLDTQALQSGADKAMWQSCITRSVDEAMGDYAADTKAVMRALADLIAIEYGSKEITFNVFPFELAAVLQDLDKVIFFGACGSQSVLRKRIEKLRHVSEKGFITGRGKINFSLGDVDGNPSGHVLFDVTHKFNCAARLIGIDGFELLSSKR